MVLISNRVECLVHVAEGRNAVDDELSSVGLGVAFLVVQGLEGSEDGQERGEGESGLDAVAVSRSLGLSVDDRGDSTTDRTPGSLECDVDTSAAVVDSGGRGEADDHWDVVGRAKDGEEDTGISGVRVLDVGDQAEADEDNDAVEDDEGRSHSDLVGPERESNGVDDADQVRWR